MVHACEVYRPCYVRALHPIVGHLPPLRMPIYQWTHQFLRPFVSDFLWDDREHGLAVAFGFNLMRHRVDAIYPAALTAWRLGLLELIQDHLRDPLIRHEELNPGAFAVVGVPVPPLPASRAPPLVADILAGSRPPPQH